MRTSKVRTGLRARLACHRRWSVYGKQLPSYTRGGSRMRESRPYGSVRGARDETRVPTATNAEAGLGTVKLPRRNFLHLTAGAAVLSAVSRVARAQGYPSRPVRIIVGFAPGQAIDIVTRMIGQWLSEQLGQQFIIENRPGAGGNIATEAVVRAPPDGYTLLAIGSNNMINATLYEKLNYAFIRDIAPVASIYRVAQVMEVNPSFPAKTVPEFITYAKAHPGQISFASAGNGSVAHVTGELFKMMTGVNMLHVPYRGAPPALTDLIGGQVHVMFDNMPSSIEHIRAGKLRPS